MSDTDESSRKAGALADISRAVMHLLSDWQLRSDEIRDLLALPSDFGGRKFNRLREGAISLPQDPGTLRRAGYLLRISESLRTSYPLSPQMSGRWMRQPHRRFGRRTPLAIIREDGESGLIAVLSELDCTFSWDLTGSRSPSGD